MQKGNLLLFVASLGEFNILNFPKLQICSYIFNIQYKTVIHCNTASSLNPAPGFTIVGSGYRLISKVISGSGIGIQNTNALYGRIAHSCLTRHCLGARQLHQCRLLLPSNNCR